MAPPGWPPTPARASSMCAREEEWAAGRLPGATLIPQADLATRLADLPRDGDLLVVCAGGMRSRRATGFLLGAGFDRAVSLEGGTDAWREAGRLIER